MSDRYDGKARMLRSDIENEHEVVFDPDLVAIMERVIASALRDAEKVAEGHMHAASRPKRAYQFTIEVGADTPKEMVWALRQIIDHIEDDISTNMISGSPSNGWVVTPNHTPGKTHEQYIKELNAYLGKGE